MLDARLELPQLHLDAVDLNRERLDDLASVLPEDEVQRPRVRCPRRRADLVVENAPAAALEVSAHERLAAKVDLRLEAEDSRADLFALRVVHRFHHGVRLEVRHQPRHGLAAHRPADQQLPVFLYEEHGREAEERPDGDGADGVVDAIARHVRRRRAYPSDDDAGDGSGVLHDDRDGGRVVPVLNVLEECHAAGPRSLHHRLHGDDERVPLEQ
mmetsp:Transcript_29159/g.69638  ORF Transcript_29159/g.69638 Transcript_29159/m.69638 type:complete len:213 (-) Transcript_29159:976-1614(-)